MDSSATREHSVFSSLTRLSRHAMRTASASFQAVSVASTDIWSASLREPLTLPTRWFGEMVSRQEPTWASEHEIVFETPIARLRDFSQGATDDVIPTLVLPPQAGHSSTIVDFSERQSQLATIKAAGLRRVLSMDWVPATQQTKDTTIEDYVALIRRCIQHIGGPVNLIGDCQGGWLAAIYAALHPEDVHTLTLAGAPIDFHAGDGSIPAYTHLMTKAFGMTPYRMLVASGGGNMPGQVVLNGFVALRPEAEVGKQLRLLIHLDDDQHLDRYRDFEDWFKFTQDIPGTFYLWLVDHLFRGNELIRGELKVSGRTVDLGAITCPLYLLAGADDHITPSEQVFAAASAVGTPASDIVERTTDGGHLGLFMGRQALRDHWPPLLADIHARSSRVPR